MIQQLLAIVSALIGAVVYMCFVDPSTPGAYVLGFLICAIYGAIIWLTDRFRAAGQAT